MKRLATLFLVFLPTLGIEAQTKAQYTERLDSIVTYESQTTSPKVQKFEFGYNARGQVAQILYYRWDEGGWFLTNKREYFCSGNFRKSATAPMTIMGKNCKKGL